MSHPIGAAVSGLLIAMPFAEGDSVDRGQVLARIECGPTQSERDIAMAELDAAVSGHERLLRESRTEERLEAEANTAAAQAAVARSKLRFDRLEALFQAGVTPPDDRDQALKDFQYAEEQHKSALQQELLIKAGLFRKRLRNRMPQYGRPNIGSSNCSVSWICASSKRRDPARCSAFSNMWAKHTAPSFRSRFSALPIRQVSAFAPRWMNATSIVSSRVNEWKSPRTRLKESR